LVPLAVVTVLIGPLAWEASRLAVERQVLSLFPPPSVLDLADVSLRPLIAFALFVGLLVAFSQGAYVRDSTPTEVRGAWRFCAIWALLPPVVLFTASVATKSMVLLSRYALAATPGLCLLLAWTIRSIEPARSRRVILQLVVFAGVAAGFGFKHGGERWRLVADDVGRLVAERPMPVLVRSGLVEMHDVEWLTDPQRQDTMLAPLIYYGLETPMIPLPWNIDDSARRQYLEGVVAKRLLDAQAFVLITRPFGDGGNIAAWLRGRLAGLGFCDRALGSYGPIQVIVFDRGGSHCAG
jgi:hypothetical protein